MSVVEHLGINIDLARDTLLSDQGRQLLAQYYMRDQETSPQEAYARASVAYCAGDMDLAQRIYDYVSKGWAGFSTPILFNAPLPGEPWKGLPISCFVTTLEDNLHSLINHTSEVRWLSVKGGGVGGYWGNIRAVSKKAPGPIPFLKTIDTDMSAYSQGHSRRGSYAAYLDVSHPDIEEFIQIRVPTGGDENRKCFTLHNAVNITDDFMNAIAEDASWSLLDPHTKAIHSVISARKLWQNILEARFRTGEPYLTFIDTANRALPTSLKEKGLKIHSSQLCNEIYLPTSESRTAVCCLLSLVLEHYDEWKNTTIIRDFIRFLDNVLQVFIDHAPSELAKAINSAKSERSLGLGAMGWHSLLQKKGIPFEGIMAKFLNMEVFSFIQKEAIAETIQLATERGEYPDGLGTGRRNSHLLAIAPNANSSIIANTSPSVEPIKSNAFTHRTRIGSHLIKNRHLEQLLLSYELTGKALDNIWTSIIKNNGSVQHLEMLTSWEKSVFKTAFEIDQEWVVSHAGDRQPYICQGQSINLFFPANTDRTLVNKVHLKAWKSGLKGLYYLRTSSAVDAATALKKTERIALADYVAREDDECLSCQA